MGSGGAMPPLACCNRSTMELPPVLSAGEIGAKNRLESRPAVGDGMTISLSRLLMCGGRSTDDLREPAVEPRIGLSLFEKKLLQPG